MWMSAYQLTSCLPAIMYDPCLDHYGLKWGSCTYILAGHISYNRLIIHKLEFSWYLNLSKFFKRNTFAFWYKIIMADFLDIHFNWQMMYLFLFLYWPWAIRGHSDKDIIFFSFQFIRYIIFETYGGPNSWDWFLMLVQICYSELMGECDWEWSSIPKKSHEILIPIINPLGGEDIYISDKS